MAEPTTSAPGTVSHERPAIDATAPVSSADHGPSEYEQHRVARGMSEAPKLPTPASPRAVDTPEPEPVAPHPLGAPPEPPEPADAPEPGDPPAELKGPEPTTHRWKDPDTGVTLDMRRRDHRRIRKLLEERAELARRIARPAVEVSPRPAPIPPHAVAPNQPDPNDPEPQLESFADEADPYLAHSRATARWEARQEFKQQQAQRTSVERVQRTQAAIDSAQQAFDAKLSESRERYPDFDQAHQELYETLGRVPMARRGPIVHRLLTSPAGHEIAYFLGNHPEELQRLTHARTPHEQAIALGHVEARVQQSLAAAPAPTSTTRAPAPTTPVNTGAPAARRSPEDLAKAGDYQSYRAARGMPATSATAAR